MGAYNPATFVYRLQEGLADAIPWRGKVEQQDVTGGAISAFGTQLHETAHWWQFIGSTSGFVQSLVIAVQAHNTAPYIRDIPPDVPLVKPLFLHATRPELMLEGASDRALTIAINNWMDLEFAQALISDPRCAERVGAEPLFDSQGHAYRMLYSMTLELLRRAVDPDLDVLPDVAAWDEPFRSLAAAGVTDYHYRAPMRVPPIGFRAIAEAQGRFHQLQFLHVTSRRRLGWDDFDRQGLLAAEYVEAMDLFRSILGRAWPASPVAPDVNLFLLLCDIALNPAVGYPLDIDDYRMFVYEVHPGYRFQRAVGYLAEAAPALASALHRLDANEYAEVAGQICEGCGWRTPQQVASAVAGFPGRAAGMQTLAHELRTNRFQRGYLPVRLLYALHLAHMEDKARSPEVFCWPGWRHLITDDAAEEQVRAWQETILRNGPAFVAKGMQRRVEYALRPGAEDLTMPANNYFLWQVFFDQVRQLVSKEGPLSYGYTWLDPARDEAYYRELIESRDDMAATLGRPLAAFEPVAM